MEIFDLVAMTSQERNKNINGAMQKIYDMGIVHEKLFNDFISSRVQALKDEYDITDDIEYECAMEDIGDMCWNLTSKILDTREDDTDEFILLMEDIGYAIMEFLGWEYRDTGLEV